MCKQCGKHVRRMEFADVLVVADDYLCLSCAPKLQDLECTVCNSSQNILAFPQNQRKQGISIRRCQSCSSHCSNCKQLVPDCRSFATNLSECWVCDKQKDLHMCDACEQTLEATAFDADVLHNSKTKKRKLVCLQCEKNSDTASAMSKLTSVQLDILAAI